MIIAGAQSIIGTGHFKKHILCQDYSCYEILPDETLIFSIADGASSAKHSDIGARLCAKVTLNYLKCLDWRQKISSKKSAEIWKELVEILREILFYYADYKNISFKDLSSTLLAGVVCSNWCVVFSIGDCYLIVKQKNSGEYTLLLPPCKFEYANQTLFVTSKNVIKYMQHGVFDMNYDFIAAGTDWLENCALNNKKPYKNFFDPMYNFLSAQSEVKSEHIHSYIEFLLNSDFINKRTDDDKTLLLCYKSNEKVIMDKNKKGGVFNGFLQFIKW